MTPGGAPEWVVMLLVGIIVLIPMACALVALVTGVKALRVIRDSSGELKGRGLAVGGILLGAAGLAFGALVATGIGVTWIASPQSLSSKSDAQLQSLVGGGGLRQTAAARLLASRGRSGRSALAAILRDRTRPTADRVAVLTALLERSEFDWTPELPALLAIMGGSDFELQGHVSPIVAGWTGRVATTAVVPYLLDPDPVIRSGATATVGSQIATGAGWGGGTTLGAAELPGLIATLEQSTDRDVRLAVIGWLELMGARARAAVPVLTAIAAGDDADASAAAKAALLVIGK